MQATLNDAMHKMRCVYTRWVF